MNNYNFTATKMSIKEILTLAKGNVNPQYIDHQDKVEKYLYAALFENDRKNNFTLKLFIFINRFINYFSNKIIWPLFSFLGATIFLFIFNLTNSGMAPKERIATISQEIAANERRLNQLGKAIILITAKIKEHDNVLSSK